MSSTDKCSLVILADITVLTVTAASAVNVLAIVQVTNGPGGNGAAVANDNAADSFTPDGRSLFIGAGSSSSNFLSGDLAELIIFNNVLSDPNRTHVELNLRDKYGLDLTDAGSYTAPQAYRHSVRGISSSANIGDSDRGSDTAGLRVENFRYLHAANLLRSN